MPTNPVPQSLREKVADAVDEYRIENATHGLGMLDVEPVTDKIIQLFAQEQQALLERVKAEVIGEYEQENILLDDLKWHPVDKVIGANELRRKELKALAALEEEIKG
jgi:hypothetical protein